MKEVYYEVHKIYIVGSGRVYVALIHAVDSNPFMVANPRCGGTVYRLWIYARE
jgi:hypothetical protein